VSAAVGSNGRQRTSPRSINRAVHHHSSVPASALSSQALSVPVVPPTMSRTVASRTI